MNVTQQQNIKNTYSNQNAVRTNRHRDRPKKSIIMNKTNRKLPIRTDAYWIEPEEFRKQTKIRSNRYRINAKQTHTENTEKTFVDQQPNHTTQRNLPEILKSLAKLWQNEHITKSISQRSQHSSHWSGGMKKTPYNGYWSMWVGIKISNNQLFKFDFMSYGIPI